MAKYDGRIIKGIGGFYYVDTADGVYECRARGVFRKNGITPMVGDLVEISAESHDMTGAVEAIKPRKNSLLRPPVANVDVVAIVVSTVNPLPNTLLLDKVIAAAEYAETEIVLCFNKIDLDDGNKIADIYKKAGFDVVCVSAKNGENTEEFAEHLRDKVTVFAGNSGVGKSSLLNSIFGKELFATGEISKHAERGKHTTRHSELMQLPFGGYIIDTPGFGSFDIALLEPENCAVLFREFEKYADDCQFADCSHTVEKGCCVLEALRKGEISQSRHDSYCRIVKEMNIGKRRR